MYEQRNDMHHGMSLGAVLIGIAAGVAGTILYATYREREFNRLVGKTRELGDKSSEYLGSMGENVRHKAVAMVDSAQSAVDNLGEKVKRAVGDRSESHPPTPL